MGLDVNHLVLFDHLICLGAHEIAVRSFPAVLGFGAFTSVLMGAFDFTGGMLTGYGKDKEVDEFERKEQLRTTRRRPVEETLRELGESNGMADRFPHGGLVH